MQGEFELDRLDYLETIRKQDQQLKLLTQILEKVQPTLRKDSNYYNLEKVKKDAVWNEDEGMNNLDRAASFPRDAYDEDSSKLRRKLAKSEEENIANSYFKPIRQSNVLNKYRGDNARNLDKKSYFPNKATTFDNLLSGVVYSDDIYGRSQSARKPARLEALSLSK
ncbi:hypothetical protein GCK32_010366 [Trichostrongylus colubriformis]|uniref:Uncharacterized protein n=1 Tax=Trichostrongylus colubriformis TaxID=6319 RepID=A0AAN8G133_TRICO